MPDDCIFCKIIKGEIPATKIYDNDKFMAFLDIQPGNKGHTLVIPKEHYETTYNMPADLLGDMMEIVHRIASAIYKALEAEGYNIFINNKPAAGQEVPHAHYHIVPRYTNDGLHFTWPKKKYEEGEMEEFKEKITKAL